MPPVSWDSLPSYVYLNIYLSLFTLVLKSPKVAIYVQIQCYPWSKPNSTILVCNKLRKITSVSFIDSFIHLFIWLYINLRVGCTSHTRTVEIQQPKLFYFRQSVLVSTGYRLRVSNGLCKHLRACEQCIYFCERGQASIFSCEQRALRKFPAIRNLSLLKHCFVPSNLADTFKTGQQTQSCST